jgi:hypothetical protein
MWNNAKDMNWDENMGLRIKNDFITAQNAKVILDELLRRF